MSGDRGQATASKVYELRNVGRVFKGAGGVRIARLDIMAGRMVAVVGDSGSGKSTLLGLLGHLTLPERMTTSGMAAGEPEKSTPEAVLNLYVRRDGNLQRYDLLDNGWRGIWSRWLGKLLRGEDFRTELGFVFQESHLLRNAPTSLNLAVSLTNLRSLPKPAQQMVMDMAEQLEAAASHDNGSAIVENSAPAGATHTQQIDPRTLPGKLSAPVRVLSGGQAQRIALGRALIRNPSVILADEPTASLDPRRGHRMMAMLRLWQRQGDKDNPRTVIWVTHDTRQAAAYADEIIILRQGQMPQWMEGRPVANPGDPEVIAHWIETGRNDMQPDAERAQEMRRLREHWMQCIAGSADAEVGHGGAANGDEQTLPAAAFTSHRENARSRSKGEEGRYRAPHVLGRLALSEVFALEGGRCGSAVLQRVTSMMGASHFRRLPPCRAQTAYGHWILLALALLLAVLATQSSAASSVLAAKAMALGAGVLLLMALAWPLVRAFSKKFDFVTFLMLLTMFILSFKGMDVIDAAFQRWMNSPQLSHVVVEPSNPGLLTRKVLGQLNAAMIKAGFTPPPAAPVALMSASRQAKRSSFVWGRYFAEADIGKARIDDSSGDPACVGASRFSVDTLGASAAEPMRTHLQYLGGTDLRQLKPVVYKPVSLRRGDGLWRVYVSQRFAWRLKQRLGVDATTGNALFCLHLYGIAHPVMVAGIVASLPDDARGVDYQLLLTDQHFRDVMRRAWKDKRRSRYYRAAAIYLDTQRIEAFMSHVQRLGENGIRVRVRDGTRKLHFGLGDAFTKIREALGLANALNAIVGVAAAVFVFLSITMTGILALNYIQRNERSLCVMRAFGIGAIRIWGMTMMQFAILLVPAVMLVGALAFWVWPEVAAMAATTLNVPQQHMLFTPLQLTGLVLAFCGVVALGCALTTAWWRYTSRWIAERLKEI